MRAYFRAKVLTAYAMALLSLSLLYISGGLLGVKVSAGHWVAMTLLILVALLPFAAIGILIGHLITTDSAGPAMGGLLTFFALLGGTYFPITGGILAHIGQLRPVVVAGTSRSHRAERSRLGRSRLDHDRGLDGDRLRRSRRRVPPGHGQGLGLAALGCVTPARPAGRRE